MQAFSTNLLLREFKHTRATFANFTFICREICGNCLLTKKAHPLGDQAENTTYVWCQLKSFSLINFYCLFNVGLKCLISNASAILGLNTILQKLLPIILKSLTSGDLSPVSIQCL